MFDAALGGSSLSWTYVQPAVAEFTTACAYDRAGFGWSEAGPMPRTAVRIAAELHELLQCARSRLPYVLVGHSFGGLSIRAYAAAIQRTSPDWCSWIPRTRRNGASRRRGSRTSRSRRRAVPARVPASRLGIASLVARLASAGALDLARGIAASVSRRTLHRQDEEILAPVTKLPMDVRAVLRWMWTQPRYFAALGSQIEHICAARRDRPDPDYGSRPLVTISATAITRAPSPARGARPPLHLRPAYHRDHSGHWIPMDEPDTVVHAIKDVVAAVRSSGSDRDRRG